MKIINEIKDQLSSLEKGQKVSLYKICAALSLLYFSYPMIRATSEAIFLEVYKAKSSPLVWVYSIITLSISILIFNKFQTKHSVHKLYMGIGIFSLLFFSLCNAMILNGFEYWAYPLYIWKEVYIVILIHIVLGYMNTILTFETAKIIYGPLGAIASIGSILGGQATAYLTKSLKIVSGVENLVAVSMLGVLIIMLGAAFFYEKREYIIQDKNDKHKNTSPLESIIEIKYYVLGIATLVLLTQFVINLANFKFNLEFEKFVFGEVEKATYLGNLYSIISIVSFILQIIVIPILFKMVKNSRIHFSVPIVYMVFFLFSLIGGANGLLPVASMFVLYKGFDYSLFSAAKEMLYFPLDAKQKYGAKYFIDMVVYRFSKGLISFVLIFVQSMVFIDSLLAICLVLWLLVLIPLFKLQRTLIKV